jgi:hypothetical protein
MGSSHTSILKEAISEIDAKIIAKILFREPEVLTVFKHKPDSMGFIIDNLYVAYGIPPYFDRDLREGRIGLDTIIWSPVAINDSGDVVEWHFTLRALLRARKLNFAGTSWRVAGLRIEVLESVF